MFTQSEVGAAVTPSLQLNVTTLKQANGNW